MINAVFDYLGNNALLVVMAVNQLYTLYVLSSLNDKLGEK